MLVLLVVAGLVGAGGAASAGEGDDLVRELQLDCVYGLDVNDSCAQLLTLNFTVEDNYGLGSSLTQTPDDVLNGDCIRDKARLSCAELAARIAGSDEEPESDRPAMCMFYRYLGTSDSTPDERTALRRLLGSDAPSGVLAGLNFFETGDGEFADAVASIDNYLYPICQIAPIDNTLVIRSDKRIITFPTTLPKGGTLADAYDAFGPASDIGRDDQVCTVTWELHGLGMTFANLGGDDACVPDAGFFVLADAQRAPWRTDKGLAVDDRLSKLKQKYPKATRGDARGSLTEWNLVVRPEPTGVGGGDVARLVALVRGGRIVGFSIRQSNAGE